MAECNCLCASAGHHEVCQGIAEEGLRSPGGFTVIAGWSICRPCHDATLEAFLKRRARSGAGYGVGHHRTAQRGTYVSRAAWPSPGPPRGSAEVR